MYRAGNSVEQVFGGTVIKQGDQTPLGFNFRDENGQLVSLLGATVQVKIASNKGVVVEKQATISDGYTVTFSLGQDDITGSGNMMIEFIVTYSGGTQEKFPSDDWQRIRITPTLEDVEKYGVGYITFEKLTGEFQNQFDEFKGDVDEQIDSQKQRVDNLISSTPQPSEIVDARLDESGKLFANVKAHLDDKGTKIKTLTKKTDYKFVDSTGDGIVDDAPFIQSIVDTAGMNQKVYFPKPQVAYRIQTPINVKQGQILEFSKNTKVYDYTNDYCFKVMGGPNFAVDAKTHITIKNAEIIGSATSLGAIKLVNVYIIDLENIKVTSYSNVGAKAIYIEDFFQVNLKTVQINSVPNGHGLFVNAVTGNSGQLNKYNTIIQRCRIGEEVIGTGNILDGVNMLGGAIGNNYEKGLKIGKNVYNVLFLGSHIENHDIVTYSGDTAIDMVLSDGTVAEGITFLNCLFENNKYAIKSNNTKRVSLIGCQFNGNNISGAIAITQGVGDARWFFAPNFFEGNVTDVASAGTDHVDLGRIAINSTGAFFPQRAGAGLYAGNVFPEGTVLANQGSMYQRTNGAEGSTVYYKISGTGNTGWKAVQVVSAGTTSQRPTTVPAGFMYSDLTLNKPIWWINNQWRDATGAIV